MKLKYMKANKSSDTRILFIIYYAGHGEMYDGSTTTQIVFNGEIRYPLEFNLSAISSMKNTYTVAIFDCCRVKTRKIELSRG
jgi:hypothetical protein